MVKKQKGFSNKYFVNTTGYGILKSSNLFIFKNDYIRNKTFNSRKSVISEKIDKIKQIL